MIWRLGYNFNAYTINQTKTMIFFCIDIDLMDVVSFCCKGRLM
jgi:hypothetical protein